MKHTNIIRNILVAAKAVALSGCMREKVDETPVPSGMEATIRLAGRTGSQTRAGETNPDTEIGPFRIMAFRADGGSLAYNRVLDFSDTETHTITMRTGSYDFLFIANEDSDTAVRTGGKTLTQTMDGYTGQTLGNVVDRLWFASSAFTVGKAIPMASICRGVTVNADNTVKLPGSETKYSTWEVGVDYLGVRVDLTLETSDAAVAGSFTGMTVANVPDRVWISQTDSEGDPLYNNGSYEASAPVPSYRSFAANDGDIYTKDIDDNETFTASDDPVTFVKGSDDVYRWHKRVILPASEFTPSADETKAIKFRVGASNQTLAATLGDDTNGYTADRDHRYRMIGTLEPGHPIAFTITVTDWGTNNRVNLSKDGEYYPDYHWGWAGSNIYWDPDLNDGAGGLTFVAETGEPDEEPRDYETYQGLFFKWGSLVGISPVGNYNATTTRLYLPHEYIDAGNSTNLAWNAIPYMPMTSFESDEKRAMLMEAYSPEDGIGDICRYLTGKPGVPSGEWRIPTGYEVRRVFNGNGLTFGGAFGDAATSASNDDTGRHPYKGRRIISYMEERPDSGNPFFPLTGLRSDNGTNANAGSWIYIQSSSPASSGSKYYSAGGALDGSSSNASPSHYTFDIVRGYPIRCVRITSATVSRTLTTDSEGKFFVADGGVKTITVTSNAKWIASIKRGTNAVTEGAAGAMGEKLITAFNGGSLNGYVTKGTSGTETINTLTLTAADFTSPYTDARGNLVIVFRDSETGQTLHETTVTLGTMFDLRSQEDNPYELHFPAIGGTAIINVLDETGASGSWSLSGFSLSAYSGTGSRTITVTVSNNPKAETITKYITLSRSGMPNRQITVYQDMPYLPEPHTGWAGSNIYWDNANKRLTFDDMAGDGTEGPQSPNEQIQGVHFMWGSLTAISPMGDYDPETSILYSPKLGANDGTNYNMNWSDIVYVSQLYSTNTAIVYDRALLYELHDPENEVGDICKYITDKGWAPGAESGVKWRMPVGNEMNPNTLFNRIPSDGSYTTFPSDNPYGLTTVPSGYRISDGKGNAFFPMTGNRYQDRIDPCGWKGHYYTSSGSTTGIFCQMAMSVIWTNQTFESGAYPVRCVREAE